MRAFGGRKGRMTAIDRSNWIEKSPPGLTSTQKTRCN